MKGNFWSFFTVNIIRSIEFVVLLFVWKLNPNATPAIISYLAIGKAYERIYSNQFGGVMATYINNGSHSKVLLYPVSYFWFNFQQVLGYNTTRSSSHSLLILLLGITFFSSDMIFKYENLIWLIIFIPINLILQYCISFIIGCSAFWITNRGDVNNFCMAAYTAIGILSGGIIPLNILFKDYTWLQYNPFSYLLHWPMQIYLQDFSLNTKLSLVGFTLIWIAFFYILAQYIFKLGLKKNESVGL
jgi:ABC-2 type transport system permease protein